MGRLGLGGLGTYLDLETYRAKSRGGGRRGRAHAVVAVRRGLGPYLDLDLGDFVAAASLRFEMARQMGKKKRMVRGSPRERGRLQRAREKDGSRGRIEGEARSKSNRGGGHARAFGIGRLHSAFSIARKTGVVGLGGDADSKSCFDSVS